MIIHSLSQTTSITVVGTTSSLVEITEILAWLGAACRASLVDDRVQYCTPLVSSKSGTLPNLRVSYEFTEIEQASEREQTAACWHQLFRNPTIVKGYPVAARKSNEKGLEIPLSIMTNLGYAPWAVRFERTMFLKGFSSLFAPMRRIGNSILWHFMANADGRRMSYNQGLSAGPALDSLEWSCLDACRHFVGWAPQVQIFTGK